MQKTTILIAGAGPTGLAMAAFLSEYNVPFRIIDKSVTASSKSKALVVQARTLEILQQLGIAEQALAKGAGATSFSLYSRGVKQASLNFDATGLDQTPFPYAEILPQDKTEELLIAYLQSKNIHIEWNTSLESIVEKGEQVELTLTNDKGEKELVTADYLVGADGAHSVVRHYMDTDFIGGTYQQAFMLTDVDVEWDMPAEDKLMVVLEKECFCIFFKFKEEKKYRIITLIPEKKEDADFDYLKTFIESNLSMPIKLSNSQWTSYYEVHHRCVDHFQQGRIFLTGDAAHIHSPAGGQGMNTGMQDAHNLAWKLALVTQGKAPSSLLATYHTERYPIAQHLVNGTDKAFKLITSNTPLANWAKAHILPSVMGAVFSFEKVQELLFHFVSQTSINYETHYKHFNFAESEIFKPGMRFPYFHEKLIMGKNIYDLLTPDSYQLFILGHSNENYTNKTALPMNIHTFNREEEWDMFNHYKIDSDIMVLVRPDMHIACVASDDEELDSYFSKMHEHVYTSS